MKDTIRTPRSPLRSAAKIRRHDSPAGRTARARTARRRRPSAASAAPDLLRPRRADQRHDNVLELIVATCPGYNLGRAYKKVTREFEQEFRSSNLTLAQFALLVNIGRREPATGSEIAQRLGSDLSTISRTIELVVDRGLVSQERGQDRRVRVYRLTEQGHQALAEAIPKWRRARQRSLSHVDRQVWQQTLRQLRHLAS